MDVKAEVPEVGIGFSYSFHLFRRGLEVTEVFTPAV